MRRPSLLGRLGGFASSAFTFAATFWLGWTIFPRLRGGDFWWFWVELFACLAIAIVLHESGHLVVGLASGEPVRKLRIGSGVTLLGFRVRGLMVQLCMNPLGGGAVYFSEVDAAPTRFHLASLAAGPGVNLIAAVYGLGLYYSSTWVAAFAVANAICFFSSAMPSTSSDGVRQHPSDGMQILRLLFRPNVEVSTFEGAEMTADARAVVVRAVEDAQLSAISEVTDEHLLRGLAQDGTIRALFDSAGLSDRIPPSKTAETDDLTTPELSVSVKKALEMAFVTARDMGIQKPNAAGICLGLLKTDCPASALMREAGITEEGLRILAAGEAQDEEDVRQARVITADLPLERWGSAADKALAYAFRVARADDGAFVGTNHLLAALVADPQSRAAMALQRIGFVLVWKDARGDETEASSTSDKSLTLSPQTAMALAGALWRTGPNYPTGTAEICLGLLDQRAGSGANLLLSAGVDTEAFIKALRYTPREWSEPSACTNESLGLWALRAGARMDVGRWLDARADFLEAERAAATDAQRALFSNNVAWVSLMSGDAALRAESLERARSATSLEPDQPAFSGTYAFALLVNGAPAEALPILEADLSKLTRPRDRASTYCLLAMCRARLNQHDEARKDLAAAVAADPRCQLLPSASEELEVAGATVG